MPRYLIAIHRPDDYDPAIAEDDAMRRDISALNDAMVAAGIRVFVGGLHAAPEARSLRLEAGGAVSEQTGPYLTTGEHMGGLWVLELADMAAALDWGRRAAVACRANVELREFH